MEISIIPEHRQKTKKFTLPPASSLTILPPYLSPHSSFHVHALPTSRIPLFLPSSLGKHPILTQQAVPVPNPGHHPSTPLPPKLSHSLTLTQIPLLTGSPGLAGLLHLPPPIELCGNVGKMGGEAERRMDCETERMNKPPEGWTIPRAERGVQLCMRRGRFRISL